MFFPSSRWQQGLWLLYSLICHIQVGSNGCTMSMGKYACARVQIMFWIGKMVKIRKARFVVWWDMRTSGHKHSLSCCSKKCDQGSLAFNAPAHSVQGSMFSQEPVTRIAPVWLRNCVSLEDFFWDYYNKAENSTKCWAVPFLAVALNQWVPVRACSSFGSLSEKWAVNEN